MGRIWYRVSLFWWLLTAAAIASPPAVAEHLQRSIPLDSSDAGFVDATAFAHNGDLFYLAGGFYGTVDFNPNGAPYIYMSTCPTTYGCSFVAAYDADMQIAWFDIFYGTGEAVEQSLVPRTGGGVYLVLAFSADLAYVPQTTQPLFHAAGTYDVAVIALDAAGASPAAVQLGADNYGALRRTHPFESAPGIVDITWDRQGDADTSGIDTIVSRVDLTTGVVSSPFIAIEATDAFSYVRAQDERADTGGRYICGIFEGTVDFDALDAHRTETTASHSAFVARYDASGALVWLSTIAFGDNGTCDGLAVGADGTLWATGSFRGSAEILYDGNPLPVELMPWGQEDAMLLAYDALGALSTSAHLGGFGATVLPERIEAAADGSLTIVGEFAGAITSGFAGPLARESLSDYSDAFVLIANADLTTRYFCQLSYNDGDTALDTLALTGPMQIETIVQMPAALGGNSYLDYALPPEHAWLHNDGTFASAYARYDLDVILAAGFEAAAP